MRIERPVSLNELVRSRGNGSIKIVTGIRRCGKSYLLKTLFKDHLLKEGISADHIIVIDLEPAVQVPDIPGKKFIASCDFVKYIL